MVTFPPSISLPDGVGPERQELSHANVDSNVKPFTFIVVTLVT